jgi:hypothetical protein
VEVSTADDDAGLDEVELERKLLAKLEELAPPGIELTHELRKRVEDGLYAFLVDELAHLGLPAVFVRALADTATRTLHLRMTQGKPPAQ